MLTNCHAESWHLLTVHCSQRLSVSCRPFAYKGELHLSYAIEIFDKSLPLKEKTKSDAYKMRFQGTGFGRVNLTTNEMHSVAAFSTPLIPRREPPCCDKNWGVWEHGKDLYIFYTLMPCLSIFKLQPQVENGAAFVYASCLKDYAAEQVSAESGLEMRDMRISGHPVLWSQYPQSLLVLVHHDWRKNGGSQAQGRTAPC